MSKVDQILDDELDPEDLDPTPRGGKNGRDKQDPKTPPPRFAAVLAAAFAVLAACNSVSTPSPTKASCDEPASWCHSTTNP
jgi:hypothetical protein